MSYGTPQRGARYLNYLRCFWPNRMHKLQTVFPHKQSLPHDMPLWIKPEEHIYFVTIVCRERLTNQLALPGVAPRIFETVRHRHKRGQWWPHIFLLMTDHIHALISFPHAKQTLQNVVSKWKEWVAKEIGIVWQRDFFEHRLRHDESHRQKADYILQNPVRKGLVSKVEDWPFSGRVHGIRW